MWGDSSLTAADGYLKALLVEAQKAHGYILQCGADLTTLLLAIQVERRGVRLWTIESSPHVANTVRSWLNQYELGSAHIITAPADLTDEGAGYAIDAARLPGPLSLVLCEASNAHPGSARRLLPCVSEKLHDSAVALVRNVRRRSDFDYLADMVARQSGVVRRERQSRSVREDRDAQQGAGGKSSGRADQHRVCGDEKRREVAAARNAGPVIGDFS